MRLLLDTHTFLWFIYRKPTGERFYDLCLNPNNALYLSVASYWEICIKVGLGKMQLTEDWVEVFEREMRVNAVSYTHLDVYKRQRLAPTLPAWYIAPTSRGMRPCLLYTSWSSSTAH